jgi:hypothetical protein
MDQQQLTRRRFIVSVIALSAAAGSTLRPGLFSVSQAWAESASPLDDPVHKAMVRMARLLFPHDALSDDVYAEILDQALSDTASSNENAANLEAAAAALDRQSGDSWQALDEAAQITSWRYKTRCASGSTTARRSGNTSVIRAHPKASAVTCIGVQVTSTGCQRTNNGQDLLIKR